MPNTARPATTTLPARQKRIRLLLDLCNVRSLVDAAELFDAFHPGDILPWRAAMFLKAILDGEPTPHHSRGSDQHLNTSDRAY